MRAFLCLYASQSRALHRPPHTPSRTFLASWQGAGAICRRFSTETETSRKLRYTAPACAFHVENFLQLGFCANHPARPRQHKGDGKKQQLHAVQMISVDFSWMRAPATIPGEHTPGRARVHCGLRDFLRNAVRGNGKTEKTIKPDVARDCRFVCY